MSQTITNQNRQQKKALMRKLGLTGKQLKRVQKAARRRAKNFIPLPEQ